MTLFLLPLLLSQASGPDNLNALYLDSGSTPFPDSINTEIRDLSQLRITTDTPRAIGKEWSVDLLDADGKGLSLTFRPLLPDNREDIYRKGRALRLTIQNLPAASTILQTEIRDGIDLLEGENIWMLVRNGVRWSLRGGAREARTISEFEYPVIDLATIRFTSPDTLPPSGTLTLRGERKYTLPAPDHDLPEKEGASLAGEWKIYDRGFNEEILQPGGDYLLQIRPSDDPAASWDLIYLSGARISPGRWNPGDLKGKLYPSGFSDLYEVMWLDSERTPLSREIKAQYDSATGMLTLLFPYWDSSMRLGRIR